MSVIKYKNPNYTGEGQKYIPISSIQLSKDEIHIGNSSPDEDKKLWINPDDGSLKYKDTEGWTEISAEVDMALYLSKEEAASLYATKEDANEIIVNNGETPSNNEEVWIDLSESPSFENYIVTEAPNNSKQYVRKNLGWQELNLSIPVVNKSESSIVLDLNPNIFYNFGTVTNIQVNLLSSSDESSLPIYGFQFSVGESIPSLSITPEVSWIGGEAPELENNKTYQITILNGIAAIGGT